MTNPSIKLHTPLAIVGMACRLPGASNLEAFWDLIRSGRSAIGEIPESRFRRDLYFHPEKGKLGKSYSSLAGLMPPPEPIRDFYHLSPGEIENADRAHLEVLPVAADAFRMAGMDPRNLAVRKAGIYVGHTRGSELNGEIIYESNLGQTVPWLREVPEFSQLVSNPDAAVEEILARMRGKLPADGTENKWPEANQVGAVLSRAFRLDGPYSAINAACASSLMALAMGSCALTEGDIDLAVIGGASNYRFDCSVLFSKAQSISGTGSRPFDDSADGLIAAEGIVVVLVKTLEKALSDGDPIQAVIPAIGISSDGRGKALWAPRAEGQIEALKRAYTTPELAARLQYIEAHATSTQLGDATELTALDAALKNLLPPGKKIPIGSVKANIGHTLEVAGLAGLVKAAVALKKETIPPVINVNTPNSQLNWDELPFVLPKQPQPWDRPADGSPRLAGVNSFGIGGCNAHVVLEEFLPSTSKTVAVPAIDRPGSREPIAVVGMSVVAAGANSLAEFEELVTGGRSAIVPLPDAKCDRDHLRVSVPKDQLKAGALTGFEYDWKRHKIPPKQIASADPLQYMLLDAADRALEPLLAKDGGLPAKTTSVVVGAMPFGDFSSDLQPGLRLPEFELELRGYLAEHGVDDARIESICRAYSQLVLQRMPALTDETGSFTSSSLATRITKSYDLMGGALSLDGGDCSGFCSLDFARQLLQNGTSDVVICAAGSRQLTQPFYERMEKRGELGTDCRPLGRDSDGTVPGEAAVVLVLKRLSDAKRDGDRIHGLIRGVGFSRQTSMLSARTTAIRRALDCSELTLEDVSAIEVASRGLADDDRLELQAISDSIEKTPENGLALGTLSGQTGYTFAASGLLAAVKSMLELERLTLYPGTTTGAPLGEIEQGGFSLPGQPSPMNSRRHDGRVFIGVNNSSGHDLAAHLVLERAEPVTTPPPIGTTIRDEPHTMPKPTFETPLRTIRFETDSFAELLSWVNDACDQPQAVWDRESPVAFTDKRFRLSLLVTQPKDLILRLKNLKVQQALQQRQSLFAINQVYFRDTQAPAGKIAFLFAGQGSQYPGMGHDWLECSPSAAEIESRLGVILENHGFPSLDDLVHKESDLLGKDVWRTQLSVLLMDTILYQVARDRGFRPDRLTGHSFGEYGALLAARAWDFTTALRATRARCEIIDAALDATTGGLLLSCFEREDVIRELAGECGQLHVSHLNSPQQTVVGGTVESITAFEQRLKKAGIRGQILPVPRPFHTPLMRPIFDPLTAALANLPIGPPYLPTLSGVSLKYVAEPSEIRTNLAQQLVEPVNFTFQIERLYDEGVRLFLEIGPGSVLTKLTHAILGSDRGYHALAIDDTRLNHADKLIALEALAEIHDIEPAREPLRDTLILDATAASPADAQPSAAPSGGAAASGRREVGGIGLLELRGSHSEMGFAHGREYRTEIRRLLTHHTQVIDSPLGERLPDISRYLPHLDELFTKSAQEELQGIADGAGVRVESVVAHNLTICPDLLAGCSQLLTKTESGFWMQGSNEDLPISLILRESLPRIMFVRRPLDGQTHLTFGIPGQVSGINGANQAGLVVTSAMLLDQFADTAPARGRLHPIVLRELLQTATSVPEAIEFLKNAGVRGGWGVCLSHAPTGEACYLEYDAHSLRVQPVADNWPATNHSLLIDPRAKVPRHSRTRYERLRELLQGHPEATSVRRTREILHDRYHGRLKREPRFLSMETIRRVDNQMSFIYDGETGTILLAARSAHDPDRFHEWKLAELIGFPAARAVAKSPLPAKTARPAIPSTDERSSDGDTWKSVVISREEYRTLSSPVPPGDDICVRLVGRLVPSLPAVETNRPLATQGATLILGDNPVSRRIEQELRAQGADVFSLATTGPIEPRLAELEDLWNRSPIRNLIVATPFDDESSTTWDPPRWQARRDAGVTNPYLLTQRWFSLAEQHNLLDESQVFALARLGGHFGFAEGDLSVESGAISGLLKGMGREYANFASDKLLVRAIDFEPDMTSDEVAAHFLDEIGLRDSLDDEMYYVTEVVRTREQRYDVRCVPIDAPATEPGSVAPGGTWVVTGGARGITAEIAKGIARQGGAKLHLLGSSPLPEVNPEWHDLNEQQVEQLRTETIKQAIGQGIKPPVIAWEKVQKALEIDRNLREMRQLGAEVTYHACDLTQTDQLAEVLNRVRNADGPIRGIVHGAGYEKSTRFSRKKPELVERTIATKVDGAFALMSQTRQDPIEFFLGFGSISGRFGGIGQTDYSVANDMLCKLISWYRGQRPKVRATVLDWHSWDEVGMAVRPETLTFKKLTDWRFLPVREGVRHFLNEWFSGCPEVECVITDWHLYKRLHPDESPLQVQETLRTAAPRYALVPEATESSSGQAVIKATIDPVRDEFLAHHTFRGRPLLPMVMAAEFLSATAAAASGGGTVRSIDNLQAQNVLRMLHDNPHNVEVTADLVSDGRWDCRLDADLVNRSGVLLTRNHPRFTGTVQIGPRRPVRRADVEEEWSNLPWKDFEYPPEAEKMYHGPAFQGCRAFAFKDNVLYTRVVGVPRSAMGTQRTGTWCIPAAVMDGCLFASGIIYWFLSDGLLCLPVGWDRCEFYQELEDHQTCYIVTKMIGKTDLGGLFEIQVVNEDKELIFEFQGYRNAEVPKTEREVIVEL